MTVIDTDLTLGTLVTEHPALARELERLGLDYCCRGRRSLEDACRDQGLDPAAVATALAEVAATDAGPDDWATMGPADLVDHLEATHHAYLWRELPRIEALADKVTPCTGPATPSWPPSATPSESYGPSSSRTSRARSRSPFKREWST